jgi:hypothetical protein
MKPITFTATGREVAKMAVGITSRLLHSSLTFSTFFGSRRLATKFERASSILDMADRLALGR